MDQVLTLIKVDWWRMIGAVSEPGLRGEANDLRELATLKMFALLWETIMQCILALWQQERERSITTVSYSLSGSRKKRSLDGRRT
jgi:hypothetical protein